MSELVTFYVFAGVFNACVLCLCLPDRKPDQGRGVYLGAVLLVGLCAAAVWPVLGSMSALREREEARS